MDKEKLLKLVRYEIDKLEKDINERWEYLHKTSQKNLPQINPYKCDDKEYWTMIIKRANPCINDDELLREYKRKKYSLENYSYFV
jgi:hypothetical protein